MTYGSSETRVLSIGSSCQGAHQIRRFTGLERASYFDWLGTPHIGLLQVLRNDFARVFERDNLYISPEGTTVLDASNGLSFRHMFQLQPGKNIIDPQSLTRDYHRRRQKLEFLEHRWREEVRSNRTLFVRQDAPSGTEAQELADALANFTYGQPFTLLILTSSPERCETADPRIAVEVFSPKSESSLGWQGVDAEWDEVLSRYAPANEDRKRLRPAVSFELRPERDVTEMTSMSARVST